MIALDLARTLQAAGLEWSPEPGDHFVIPDRGLDHRVFVISTMVVEAMDTASGRVLAFNGTTEWALDSIEAAEVVWLPREHQLRDLLGDDFVSLELSAGADRPASYVVTAGGERYVDLSAEAAYARAVLARLSGQRP